MDHFASQLAGSEVTPGQSEIKVPRQALGNRGGVANTIALASSGLQLSLGWLSSKVQCSITCPSVSDFGMYKL